MPIPSEETVKYLSSPIQGKGAWMERSLRHRRECVRACMAQGPVVFETVRPPGYTKAIERCTRCLLLKRFHDENQ